MPRHGEGKKPVRVSDWHKADVKAALEKAGWTFRGLARHYSVHSSTLLLALRSRYPKSERRIANAIGIDPAQIWPSRYKRDGTPKRGRGNHERVSRKRRSERSTAGHGGHGKGAGLN
jgi:Ner family transcriptional regulator